MIWESVLYGVLGGILLAGSIIVLTEFAVRKIKREK